MATASTRAPTPTTQLDHAPPQPKARWPWLKYATPILVLLLAAAVTIKVLARTARTNQTGGSPNACENASAALSAGCQPHGSLYCCNRVPLMMADFLSKRT